MVAVVLVLLLLVCLYFFPTILGAVRKVPDLGSLVVINLFLGWTFVGWIVSLAMACRSRSTATLDARCPPPAEPPERRAEPDLAIRS